MLPRRDRHVLLGLAGLALGLMALAALGGAPDQALAFVPLLVLVLPLAGGRYVGEGSLARLGGARAPAHRAAIAEVAPAGLGAPRVLVVRGGRLIAASLAVRPPPAGGVAAA